MISDEVTEIEGKHWLAIIPSFPRDPLIWGYPRRSNFLTSCSDPLKFALQCARVLGGWQKKKDSLEIVG